MTVRTIDEIFRDFVTDGVPASGPFNPHKPDIRDTLKALTEGSDNFPDNRVIRLNNADEGTANNIVVTASVAIPAAAYQVLYILNVTQENTGPVIVSGAINRDLVTNINQPIAPGYLIPGMALLCIDTGTELRLLSYGDAEAILAAAEDAAARAEAAAASVNLPPATTGDKGKVLSVNSSATGYEFRSTAFVVENRTLLKALPTFLTTAFLSEVGREGTFVLKAGSPPVADTQEGVYVVSNTAGYYWERVYAPAMAPTVRAFGAALDGTTDDSNAIKAALAVCGLAFVPWTATGFKAGGIILSTNQEMKAERKTYWKLPASSSYGVRVTGYAGLIETIQGQFTRLSGFHMDAKDCPTTTTGVRFGLSSGVVYGFRMSDMNFTNFGEAIGDEAHATNYIVDFIIDDVACTFSRGRQIYSRRSAGMIQFKNIKVDHTLNSGPVTWEGARFEAVAGLELENFDVLGPAFQNTYQASSIALVIVGIGGYNASVWLKRVLVDTTNGPGIHIENVYNVISENMGVHLTYGHSITLSGVSKGRFSNTSVLGAKGRPTPLAGAQGLRLVNCTGVRFVNTEVYDCTGHGIVLSDSISCQFTNTATRDNVGTGVLHSGTSNYNTFAVLSSLSNAGGSLTQVGGQSATVNWYPNSSVFTASTIGAATVA